ncbi:MAG: arginine deiminase family protein [Chloroflexota bacterium]|jgi:dimethylargininase
MTTSHVTQAIVRQPGSNCMTGLTTGDLGPPDYDLLLAQHQAYVDALCELGLWVEELPAEPDYPDAYFVEDTAVVMPEVAVITIPGAPSRRGEQESIAQVLARQRMLAYIEAPGHLEGGDVLMVGRHFFIGLSERTNEAGAEQLAQIVAEHGYTSSTVPVGPGLHLKSSVNVVGPNTLLLTADFAGHPAFARTRQIVLDEAEAYASNTLLINDTLIMPAGFPLTWSKLEALGQPVIELDVSEIQKMDGGLTCMSLRF